MATLTVTKFATPDGAQKALDVLKGLEPQRLITIQDAAIVSWPEGAKKPTTQNFGDMTGPAELHGAFWGMLIGLIFFMPLLGAAVGALSGALAGHFADYGIDDTFIASIREKVTPGTSALFLLSSDVVVERVAEALKAAGLSGEFIATNLSADQEANLRAAFGAE
jgi:uncharacterized membrane protein